ncbi:MAG: class I SAM-dependent methyltransferase [Bryobacteraceae bacterium]
MKRRSALLALVAPVAAKAQRGFRGGFRSGRTADSLPLASTESEKRILGVLQEAWNTGATYANVPHADGRMLRLLAETSGAKRVVEIGTSTGLSGLWFCLALHKTGGRLTTFEYDARRAATARKHFEQAGVAQLVTIVEGDAHQTISRLKEPIDILFLDADKEGYVDYLNRLLPLVRPGGLILAHNIDMVPDYDRAVNANPALETQYFREGGGMSITLKKL